MARKVLDRVCKVEGCTNVPREGFVCRSHYDRMKRNGTYDYVRMPKGEAKKWLLAFLEAGNFPEICVQWPFNRDDKGYSQSMQEGYKRETAHQISCAFVNGEKPFEKAVVRHLCGKGHEGCINPKHLAWGTHSENVYDKFEHTGAGLGELSGMSKLTNEQVLEIFERSNSGKERQVDIAEDFGVKQTTVSSIKLGRTWSHLTSEERAA